MPGLSADLKKDVIRLALARVDIRCASALAEELADGPDNDISYRSWGLLTGMVVSYARPFTTSYAYGRLEEKWSKFSERPDLERHHDRLIEYRHTLLAHNDLSSHREVVVFPSGGVLNEPLVTEGRSPIGRDGIREVVELFQIQDERMKEELLSLVTRLQKEEQWPPDQGEIRLRLDDV